jgi:hypothetical protein
LLFSLFRSVIIRAIRSCFFFVPIRDHPCESVVDFAFHWQLATGYWLLATGYCFPSHFGNFGY